MCVLQHTEKGYPHYKYVRFTSSQKDMLIQDFKLNLEICLAGI
jgi:hypothetical protein